MKLAHTLSLALAIAAVGLPTWAAQDGAKTPEERNALMAEHMKTMQEGMTMMDGMAPSGMGGMKDNMAAHHQMMEKRMDMMQATMQMMMDRLPAAPQK